MIQENVNYFRHLGENYLTRKRVLLHTHIGERNKALLIFVKIHFPFTIKSSVV